MGSTGKIASGLMIIFMVELTLITVDD